jgi:transcriptional regulator with XRE-family HTH domain
MSAGRPLSDRPSRVVRQSSAYKGAVVALGLRVRALRRRRKWTLEQAAEATNLDLKHFQKIEAGKLNVTLVTVVRIAEGFGEPIESLFRKPRSKG